jgi:hypothetical protein
MTNEKKGPGAPRGNTNGQKYDEPSKSWLQVRVPRRMKSAWVRAAKRRPLSEWVIEALNRAAGL